MSWDRGAGDVDEMVAASHHVDLYWFPHTERTMAKQNIRTDLDPGEQRPPARLTAWWEDDFLSNRVFGAGVTALRHPRAGGHGPADQPGLRTGAVRADLQRPGPPRVRQPATGGVPRDGVRRAARGRAGRAARVSPRHRRERLAHRVPGRGPAAPRPTTWPLSTRPWPRHPLPRLPHRPAGRRPHGVLRRSRAGAAGGGRPPALGQAAHPDGGRPGAVVPPASATSWPSATVWTPTGSSSTRTCGQVLGD